MPTGEALHEGLGLRGLGLLGVDGLPRGFPERSEGSFLYGFISFLAGFVGVSWVS